MKPAQRQLALLVMVLVALPATAVDAQSLARVAERSNQGLPKMVAKDLRMDRVDASGQTITHHYTHLALNSAQLRAMRLEATQRPHIAPPLCAASDTGRMLREGVRFRYVYRGSEGAVGGDLVVTQSDC